jgi:hypothetical protein
MSCLALKLASESCAGSKREGKLLPQFQPAATHKSESVREENTDSPQTFQQAPEQSWRAFKLKLKE